MLKEISPVWVAIIINALLGLSGIFEIKKYIFKPKLKLSIKLCPPDCHIINLANKESGKIIDKVYYLRFLIQNNGNKEARNVEVLASSLNKKENKEWKKVESFLPLNLTWSHLGGMTMRTIPSKTFRHCDLGFLARKELKNNLVRRYHLTERNHSIVLKMDTIVEPNTGSHIILPGDYLLTMYVSSYNAKTIKENFEIKIKDNWNDLGIGEKMIEIKKITHSC